MGGFRPQDVEELLARTGRMCAICKGRHRVQLHHITPVSGGGTDEIDNAIPLCPNCHDEVHSPYAPGRVGAPTLSRSGGATWRKRSGWRAGKSTLRRAA